ncbi:replication initiator protein A [Bradyrhizobium pachyrhizi]|uniref:replication initiator protein A n=1 Tax=Bradyrhizobium pachyrhizi TaxID=280333 RepID=UPI003D15F960
MSANESSAHHRLSERELLDLFRAIPSDLAPRDAQDLMALPFYSLAKTKRIVPIDCRVVAISIHAEAVPKHGTAAIWDANVLIWAAYQIVESSDAVSKPTRPMAATADESLIYVGRGTRTQDYDQLKAGSDRLQSTTVQTSIMLAPPKTFACDVRQLVEYQTLPGYQLKLMHDRHDTERQNVALTPVDPLAERFRGARSHSTFGGQSVNPPVPSGTATHVLSGTRFLRYLAPKSDLSDCSWAFASHHNFIDQKSFGDQITSRIGGDCQRQAACPAWPQKPHTLFTELRAYGSQPQPQGAAA